MGREFELKFQSDPAQQRRLLESYPHFSTITMETTYYDTPDGALSQRHITLRRRMENGVAVCTLKTPEKSGGRGEWEVEMEEIEAAIPELCKLSGWAGLMDLTKAGVMPVCGARFTRQAKLLERSDCTVEIAVDSGVLLGGGREIPLCEIEVEHKNGSEEATVRFASALAAELGLRQEKKSKFRRALALAKGEEDGAV